MKTKLLILTLLVMAVFLSGCAQKISEIKNPDYVGKTVVVRGTVENTLKIGKLSGYTLVDGEGNKIGVSSSKLPAEGDIMTVKGVLMKDTLLGYYIKAD